jgi:hypothetical protein
LARSQHKTCLCVAKTRTRFSTLATAKFEPSLVAGHHTYRSSLGTPTTPLPPWLVGTFPSQRPPTYPSRTPSTIQRSSPTIISNPLPLTALRKVIRGKSSYHSPTPQQLPFNRATSPMPSAMPKRVVPGMGYVVICSDKVATL